MLQKITENEEIIENIVDIDFLSIKGKFHILWWIKGYEQYWKQLELLLLKPYFILYINPIRKVYNELKTRNNCFVIRCSLVEKGNITINLLSDSNNLDTYNHLNMKRKRFEISENIIEDIENFINEYELNNNLIINPIHNNQSHCAYI